MKKLFDRWEALCASSPILRFVDINLRGVGQVMFQDNPLTGLLFLAAVAWGSFAAGAPEVFVAGALAVVTATLAALWLRVDRPTLNAGLYGYNGVLVGLALATFITSGPLLWVYVVLGAAVSVVATLGTANALRPLGVAALTFPFVLVTWILLLATYAFSGLAGSGLPSAAVITPFELLPEASFGVVDFVKGVLLSISQVFLKGSGVAALLLLAGLAVSSVWAAAFALGGAILAVVDRPSLRRRKRSHRRGPARLQPGADRGRARRDVPPAEPARRGLRGARHGLHRRGAGRPQCRLEAVRDSGADGAIHSGLVDVPAPAPVLRTTGIPARGDADARRLEYARAFSARCPACPAAARFLSGAGQAFKSPSS